MAISLRGGSEDLVQKCLFTQCAYSSSICLGLVCWRNEVNENDSISSATFHAANYLMTSTDLSIVCGKVWNAVNFLLY